MEIGFTRNRSSFIFQKICNPWHLPLRAAWSEPCVRGRSPDCAVELTFLIQRRCVGVYGPLTCIVESLIVSPNLRLRSSRFGGQLLFPRMGHSSTLFAAI